MIARTPFDAPTLTSLAELDLASLPPGTTEAYTLNGTTFYRVSWLLAVRPGAVSYVGEAASASAQLERLAAIEQQLLDLHAEHEGLIACLMPPAAPAPARKAEDIATITCGVDGCTAQLAPGHSMLFHRQRKHRDWFRWQQSLDDGDPAKAKRGAILQPHQRQAPQRTPEVAPVVPFDLS